MSIFDTDAAFELRVAKYHVILQKAMREARIQVSAEWNKWEQDILIDSNTPDPLEVRLGKRIPVIRGLDLD